MTIGFVTPRDAWESLNYVRQTTAAALVRTHQLSVLPAEYAVAPRPQRRELLREWMTCVDVLVGPLDHEILLVRREMERPIPWAVFVFGGLPRGAFGLSTAHRNMYTSDVLICSSTADMALATKMFPNSRVRLVPFAYDDAVFYPASAEAKQAARSALGLDAHHKVVLYSGRLTVEKNVHTVLRTFRIVCDALPEARLIIAGDEMRAPFREFGTLPLSIKRLLRRVRTQLGLDGAAVMLIGQQNGPQLRDMYSAADVLLNLTLHHDENFGLAQVEAMACGLPVVGAAWGGLKDTILDGLTGAQVPTVVTAAGVKVDWWAAANSVARLLRNNGLAPEMRRRCSEHARAQYSPSGYADRLEEVLQDCAEPSGCQVEVLTPSAFAAEYWAVCGRDPEGPPPYRRGVKSLRLYRELIAPYATATSNDSVDSTSDIWCLAAPLSLEQGGVIAVNDPIFPFEFVVPRHLADAVRSLVQNLATRPVQSTESLVATSAYLNDALCWMRDNGLILRTQKGDLTPDWNRVPIGRPMCRMQRVDHEVDLVWLS